MGKNLGKKQQKGSAKKIKGSCRLYFFFNPTMVGNSIYDLALQVATTVRSPTKDSKVNNKSLMQEEEMVSKSRALRQGEMEVGRIWELSKWICLIEEG